MKHYLLSFLLTLAAFCVFQTASAKEPEEDESSHVIVTLKSGEKVEGYVSRGWHAENSLFKKENFSFQITKTPDGKEPIKFTAEEVTCIDYVEVTENHPDGLRWESRPIARPNFKSRYNTMQRLVCVNKVGKNATTYWWKIWVASGVNGMSRSLQTNYGIRFHNDPEGIVYPYMLVNSVLMKDKYPGLQKFCKNWFKGPDGKLHDKLADENDSWILDMYDAYLEQMGDEAANLPYSIKDKKAKDK